MRKRVTYLLGLAFVAILALGAYQAYSMSAQTACTCPNHINSSNGAYHHALLKA